MNPALFSASIGAYPLRIISAVTRAPLGPLDSDADGCTIHHDLPVNALAEISKFQNKRYLRANFFSVSVPGLPFVSGGSSERPDLFMNWFAYKYTRADLTRALIRYCQRGYTDFLLMLSDAIVDNLSLTEFIDLALFIKSFNNLRITVSLGSKDMPGCNDNTWQGWPTTKALPALRQLIQARAIDKVIVGFELDLWNKPENMDAIMDAFASECGPANIPLYEHHSANHDWWDTLNRVDYWRYRLDKCRGIMKQNDPWQSVALQQARLDEDQVLFSKVGRDSDGNYLDVVACEYDAMRQFPTYENSEDRGDAIGYQLCCTPGFIPIMGFCGGARMPNGSVI